jgi:DNA repair protein RadC
MKTNSIQIKPKPPLKTGWLAETKTMTDAALLGELFRGHQNRQPQVQNEQQQSAEQLLQSFGGLRGLAIACRKPGIERAGLDDQSASLLRVTMEIVRRQLQQNLQRGVSLTSPAMTMEYLQTILRDRSREIFTCLFLDTRHRVISVENLFQGSIDGACVYPRVVAERALRLNAAAVIVAHNHPSGVSEPSLADQAITRRLKDALLLLEIRLLDHFVVGDGLPVSMASRGML